MRTILFIIVYICLLFFYYNKMPQNPEAVVFCSAITFIIFAMPGIIGMRGINKGVHLIKKKQYVYAIIEFQKAYDFFDRHAIFEKYCILIAPLKFTGCYREMAMENTAFCFFQLKDYNKALKWYKKVQREFPENTNAKALISFLESEGEIFEAI